MYGLSVPGGARPRPRPGYAMRIPDRHPHDAPTDAECSSPGKSADITADSCQTDVANQF